MSRSIDSISHDVENLKMKIFVPKFEESIKALYVSMDESKKRTALLRARGEFLEKAFSSDFFRKSDEDFKMIGIHSNFVEVIRDPFCKSEIFEFIPRSVVIEDLYAKSLKDSKCLIDELDKDDKT